MTLRHITFLFLMWLVQNDLSGQVQISGKVLDSETGAPIPYSSITISPLQQQTITEYGIAEEDGNFNLSFSALLPLYTIRIRSLGYNSIEQSLVLEDMQDTIVYQEYLLTRDTLGLKEVVVVSPVIIKNDTIIYDITQFTDVQDGSLEEVLYELPGLKILGNGDIEVYGKLVDKVVVDGKEISDVGARSLTRSISASDVQSVEIRLDEKNNQLKESLLDEDRYVVLDIKLKESLKKSWFGKVEGNVGAEEKFAVGAYGNVFSLHPVTKLHLFGQYDQLGDEYISLEDIKNLGAESVSNMMKRPADSEELIERTYYHDEIYGFKDFVSSEKDLVGLSLGFELSKKINLYLGSYNSYHSMTKIYDWTQNYFNENLVIGLEENNDQKISESKNKIDFRYDDDKTKIKVDLNYVYTNENNRDNSTFKNENFTYGLRDNPESSRWYQNALLEKEINKKLLFRLSGSYVNSRLKEEKTLNEFGFSDTQNESIQTSDLLHQKESQKSDVLLSDARLQYKLTRSALFGGMQYDYRKYSSKAESQGSSTNLEINDFRGNLESRISRKIKPYIGGQFSVWIMHLSGDLGYAINDYPLLDGTRSTSNGLVWSVNASPSVGVFDNVSLSYSQDYSVFPLSKYRPYNFLNSFQSYTNRADSILEPKKENVLEVSIDKYISDRSLTLGLMMLQGKVKNRDKYESSESGITEIHYNQLPSSYFILSTNIEKKYSEKNLSIMIEPEYFSTQDENYNDNRSYQNKTARWLMGMKLNYTPKENLSLFFYPKYSYFTFTSDLDEFRDNQKFFSLTFNSEISTKDKKWQFKPFIKYVNFLGEEASSFINVDFAVRHFKKKYRVYFTAENIFDTTDFEIRSIHPTVFYTELHRVFGRNLKLGFEYRF